MYRQNVLDCIINGKDCLKLGIRLCEHIKIHHGVLTMVEKMPTIDAMALSVG